MLTVFQKLYRRNLLRNMESVSGSGSTLEQTGELRSQLPLLLNELGVRSVLDAPCGDFNWMRHVVAGIEHYTGVDVVPDIIEANQRSYGCPTREFRVADICQDPLPCADLVLCRDCLVHLCFADIFRAIGNFRRSGSRYLLTTTFTGLPGNADIVTGEWRPLNLLLPPFGFPVPERVLNERCSEGSWHDKCLALWPLEALRL
jgi:SAM-dependent methyltransferase